MAFDSGLNRLIALGGTYNPTVVDEISRGRATEQNRQMNNLSMQESQQQMGAFPEQNRLANLAKRQAIASSQQRVQGEQQAHQIKVLGGMAKTVLQAKDRPSAYRQAFAQLPSYGVDTSKIPPEYSEEIEPGLTQMVEIAGMKLDEKWKTRSRGDALTRVNLGSGKEERVLGASDATGVTKTMEIKPIGDSERRNMGKEFEIAGMLDKLVTNYDDKYSGFFSTNLADLAVAAGKRGIKYDDMANYMTEYQEWKNLVRNSLFGSQLTAPEMREFERQAINPAYTAKQNRKILKRQQELLARGKTRAILALKARGWTEDMIEGFEGTYESDELTPEEMQELELRESVRPQEQGIGTVPRNPPVAP